MSEILPDVVRERYARKFAVIGLVIILVVTGIGLWTQTQVSGRLIDEKKQTVQTNAELEAESFGAWLSGQKNQVRTLSNHRSLQSDKRNVVREGLQRELDSMPREVVQLHYVKQDTRTITASTRTSLEGKFLNETEVVWNPYVGFNFTSETAVLESFVYKEGDKPSVALASQVPETDHVVVSIIRTNLRAENFSSSIDGTRTVAIGGITGLILFSEDRSEVLTSYKGEGNSTLEKRVVHGNASKTGNLISEDNVVGYSSVPGTDWIVVKQAPKSEALALESDVRNNLIVLIGTALLGLVVLNLAVARGPMRSLRTLSEEAQAIARGDLSMEIKETDRIDEVGKVRSSFRDTKAYVDTAAAQTDAIASQEFDDPVLEEEVPGTLGESLESTKNDLERSISEMESARKEAEVARQEAEQLAEYLTEQAKAYSNVMQQVSAGDLTQRMEPDGQEDSMDQIAEEFNEMIAELEKTTGQLQSYVDEVEQAGKDVENSADTVRDASEQVADSIQKISDDAYDQKERLQQIAETMSEIGDSLESLHTEHPDIDIESQLSEIREMASTMSSVVELADNTMGEAEQVAGAAQEQAAELNGVSERANDLQRYAEPLKDILDRFETEEEHEFVFSVGPTGSDQSDENSPGETN